MTSHNKAFCLRYKFLFTTNCSEQRNFDLIKKTYGSKIARLKVCMVVQSLENLEKPEKTGKNPPAKFGQPWFVTNEISLSAAKCEPNHF